MASTKTGTAVLPEVGTPVVLTASFDMFPHVWEAGERGAVEVSERGRIEVRLDEHYPELDAWDNCLVFYSEEIGITHEAMLSDFHARVEAASPAPGP